MSTPPDTVATTDNELLMQFVRHRDEGAFRQLVERHGHLIMGICRQIARDEQDAEDAFQATLLILAKRAPRLIQVTSLGGWLHRVAYRTALRTLKRSRRRESRLAEEPTMKQEDALQDIQLRELQQVLHEELQQLPTRYRDPIVLCDLESQTRAQAADQLDRTEPAIKAALARGRRLLRMRLLRRGVVLSAALLTAKELLASVSVTPQLMEVAISSCVAQSTGATMTCSKSAYALARSGAIAMTLSSMTKPVGLVVCAALLVAAPLILLAQVQIGSNKPSVVLVGDDPLSGTSTSSAATTSVLGGDSQDESEEAAGRQDRIKSLMSELHATLIQQLESVIALYQAGKVHTDEVISTRHALLDAELAIAKTATDRLSVYEKHLQQSVQFEEDLTQRWKAGSMATAAMLSAKAARIKVELAMLREQVKGE